MANISYITLNLDQIKIWKPEVETLEYCKDIFGELGYMMHDYYKTFDLDVFDRNKQLIEKTFVDTLLHQLPVPLFFHKLDKLMMLKHYWGTHNKWRDPIVVTWMGQQDGMDLFYSHPGRDRVGIMNYFKVQSYSFLNINNIDIKEHNLELIKQHWGDYQNTVFIKKSSKDSDRYIIGNLDGDSTYHKFSNLKTWLSAK
jgi:hypothetical protein